MSEKAIKFLERFGQHNLCHCSKCVAVVESEFGEKDAALKRLREERCYICRPDDPEASEEGCKDCDEKSDLNQHIERLEAEVAEARKEIGKARVYGVNGGEICDTFEGFCSCGGSHKKDTAGYYLALLTECRVALELSKSELDKLGNHLSLFKNGTVYLNENVMIEVDALLTRLKEKGNRD